MRNLIPSWFRKAPAPLTGAPKIRRQKTYSSQSGYVYQYFYEGQRPFEGKGEQGTEYVFAVSADRKTSFPVSVRVSERALGGWEAAHGRALHGNERYAIAKMALFAAFDGREDPRAMTREVEVQAEEIEGIVATLDLD
jgi:hypothetical protein